MSKTKDVYIIREHENAALTRTIPEQHYLICSLGPELTRPPC